MRSVRPLALASLTLCCAMAHADNTYHVLANGAFAQDWSNPALITTANDWSTAPSFEGYLSGDALPGTANDPRTIVDFAGATLQVTPNIANLAGYTAAGVIDAAIADPVVALQATNAADIPFLMLHVNTTGCSAVQLSYRLRDLDSDTAVQPFVLQSRVGATGNFAEVPGTYIADANTGADSPFSIALPAGLTNQAQVQLRWITNNVPGADAIIGIDDIQLSGTCTGGVDNPPQITSTTPLAGATNVLPSANLAVQFSEPVTTSTGWYALSCNGNTVNYVESGTGSSRTIDPQFDLPFGASCTVNITGASVLDTDGTPDPLASNPSFSFTVQADNAPTVASTSPTAGQTNVPVASNILLTFSEPVTTTGSWFALNCGAGTVAVTASGTGALRTLNPDANLPAMTSCTLTLTNSLIADLDGTPDALAGSNFTLTFVTNAGGADYYASVDSSSAAALRSTLHALIDGHTVFPYSASTTDTWDILEAADQNPANSAQILDVYKNATYAKAGGGNNDYNREHTWPNSLGFNDATSSAPYTDCHMLYLSNIGYNSNRGNKPFDNCPGCTLRDVTDVNNGGGGGGDDNFRQGNDGNTGTYTPWTKRRGDIARAILYMDVRYEGDAPNEPDLIVTNNRSLLQINTSGTVAATGYMGVLDVLLQWHRDDPPNEQEVLRNGVVQSFQGNRNPFIDHPEYVECLWGGVCGGTLPDAVFKNGFE